MKRIRLLSAGRALALGLFIAIAAALAVYLIFRSKHAVPEQSRPKLQGKVVAVFNNTRYSHEVNGQIRFNITAGTDRTYEDGTHELEQVKLESYGAAGERHDVVTCDRAKVSDPADLSKLDAEFISNVVVETSDGLKVKTSYLHYDQAKNTVDTKEPVDFEGRAFAGRATGMIIEAATERATLLKDVDVTIKTEETRGAKGSIAGAFGEPSEDRAARRARKRARKQNRQRIAELAAKESGSEPSTTQRKGVSNQSTPGKPTRIRCEAAILEKKEHRVTFDGNAIVTQGADEFRADRMVTYTDATNHIERIEARGAAYLKQAEKAEIKSPEMDFFFSESHQLARAIALRGASTRSLGPEPVREASADTIEATFTEGPQASVVESITAQGSAILKVHAPAPASDADNPATRELSAETVTMQFND